MAFIYPVYIFGMSPSGLLQRLYNGINKHLSRVLMPRFVWVTHGLKAYRFLGEGDGAWPVLELPQRAVCYCVGVGVNATYDLGLAAEGHEVHSFDPTPKALDYAQREKLDERGVRFHPIGIWNTTKTLRFYAPSNRAYANYSVVDLHGTGEAVEARCERLVNVMAQLNHQHIDLLKLDVEGSWQPILDDMIASNIRPKQLCVEFDSPTSTWKMLRMIRRLEAVGYHVRWFERENFLFSLEQRDAEQLQ